MSFNKLMTLDTGRLLAATASNFREDLTLTSIPAESATSASAMSTFIM
jgi:hypothetical protein